MRLKAVDQVAASAKLSTPEHDFHQKKTHNAIYYQNHSAKKKLFNEDLSSFDLLDQADALMAPKKSLQNSQLNSRSKRDSLDAMSA